MEVEGAGGGDGEAGVVTRDVNLAVFAAHKKLLDVIN